MKLTAIILLSASLTVSAKSDAQVNLKEQNAPLETVLTKIRQQTGYVFFYSQNDLQQAGKVTVDLKNASLKEALTVCLTGQPLTFTIESKTVFISKATASNPNNNSSEPVFNNPVPPPIDVTGRVTDSTGSPLQGASVLVKGTKQGTRTDANGNFTLKNVDENAFIEISFSGYASVSFRATNTTALSVVILLQEIKAGDEIVIQTGYETKKPNEVTGSYFVVDNKTLNEQTGPNILQRIDGVATGVLFDSRQIGIQKTRNLTVRGYSTINGVMDPLIVLDNFIYEGSIDNINPNDIENISILKDAAATSIWGPRASNGVIVITSKKSKFNQKLKVELNNNIIIGQRPDIYDLPVMSTSDYIEVEQFLFNKGDRLWDTLSPTKPAFTPVFEILLKRMNGQISAQDSAILLDKLKGIDSRDEYYKHLYRNAVMQQYSLNLRGGGDNISWLFSGNYLKSIDNLHGTYDKINAKISNSYKPLKNLTVNFDVYYTKSKARTGAPDYNSIFLGDKKAPYLKFFDENGKEIPIDRYRYTYTDTVAGGRLLDWKYYPLQDYKHDRAIDETQEIITNIRADYKILKGLNFTASYQYQRQWLESKALSEVESFAARDLINRFTRLRRNSSVADTFQIPRGDIVRLKDSYITSNNFRSQLSYNTNWNGVKNSITAIVGAEIREVVRGGGSSSTIYGYNNDPLSQAPVDYFTRYRTLVDGSLATIPGSPLVEATSNTRFVNLYGNAAYYYKQRYSFSISARRDASNTFGLSTNDKWNPFWSFGGGWEISKESFFKMKWVSYLKLRTTLGLSGNVSPNKTSLPIALSQTNSITTFPIRRINDLNNPFLRWEKTKQFNIGLDFSVRSQVLTGSVDFYSKKSNDLYGDAPYDYTAWGVARMLNRNVANMSGKGLDVSLESRNTNGAIIWTTRLLLSHNVSKVTKYYSAEANDLSQFILNGENNITPIVGRPLFALVAYKWGGLNATGDPQGYLNGQLSTDYQSIFAEAALKGEDGNIIYMGSADPTIYGSITNSLSWKNISFSFNISYRLGYYFRKPMLQYGELFAGGMSTEYEHRWQNPGDEQNTNVPAMVYSDYPQFTNRETFYARSSINVLKADHARLQYMNVNYTLMNNAKRLPFEQIGLYFNVANLGVIWTANKEKIDPIYSNSIKPSKQYTIGINATF